MRRNEAIRAFEQARKQAIITPTWRLKLRTHWARRKTRHYRTDANLLRLIALQHELRHRPRSM